MKAKSELRQFRSTRFWANVKALQQDANISDRSLSETLGLSPNYMTNAYQNCGIPNVFVALTLADLFNTTVEELSFGAIGIELRLAQIEQEKKRLEEELEEAKRDIYNIDKKER